MKKSFTLLLLTFGFSTFIFSQNLMLTPTSVNSGGEFFIVSNQQFAWSFSIGDPVVTTIGTGDYIFSQGFQQPEPPRIVKVQYVSDNLQGWSAFPNPTKGEITLKPPQMLTKKARLTVWNQMGQQVFPALQLQSNRDQYILDLSPVPDGIYFINISDHTGQKSTIKIIKLRL